MQIIVDIILFLILVFSFLLILAWIWKFWNMYTQQKYLSSMDFVLLEIKLPREIFKSPEAMEIIANAFLQGGGVGSWYVRNWKGAVPTFFSLEIASLEGDVKFYVRCEKKFVQLIKNNFYSQYPGIQMIEAEDYVTSIFYEHRSKDVAFWGLTNKLSDTFTLSKTPGKNRDDAKDEDLKVPADYKMIRTYVDFKQDKDPKEEFEHDPLTPVLEWLGSLKKGEYAYYQIMVQDTGKWNGSAFPKTYHCEATHEEFTLKELADERRKQLRTKITPGHKKGEIVYDEYGNEKKKTVKKEDGTITEEFLTYGKDVPAKVDIIKDNEMAYEDREEIERIHRKLSKPLLRAAIRVVYIAKNENANVGQNVQSLLSVFKQYTGPGYNSFAPNVSDPYTYSWENTKKKRTPWRHEEMFEAYVEREGFYIHLPGRENAETWYGKLLASLFVRKGLDHWADVALFDKSLGFRKKFRLIYEGFMDPFGHPHAEDVFTINLEELASLWHLPGTVATTPGIKRIDSITTQAPDNLPR